MLSRLAFDLGEMDVELLFRAHPHDVNHLTGAYDIIFNNTSLSVTDVTDISIAECFQKYPLIIITQFSSVAIEAGFYGIPAVTVLYEGIGASKLKELKDCKLPPWCVKGAAFIIHNKKHQRQVMETAMSDILERNRIINCFDDYFSVGNMMSPKLESLVKEAF